MARVTAETRVETRRRLLFAAADEFAESGVEKANINRISVAAGLAKGTVYNYFDSKRALFLAVCEEACRLAAAEADDLPGASTRQRLVALLESDMRWVKQHPAFARVLLREGMNPDPESYAALSEAAAPFTQRVVELLEEGVERGEVRSDLSSTQLALWLIGMDQLALLQHWGSGGAWPALDDIPELVVTQFLDGAAPRADAEEHGR